MEANEVQKSLSGSGQSQSALDNNYKSTSLSSSMSEAFAIRSDNGDLDQKVTKQSVSPSIMIQTGLQQSEIDSAMQQQRNPPQTFGGFLWEILVGSPPQPSSRSTPRVASPDSGQNNNNIVSGGNIGIEPSQWTIVGGGGNSDAQDQTDSRQSPTSRPVQSLDSHPDHGLLDGTYSYLSSVVGGASALLGLSPTSETANVLAQPSSPQTDIIWDNEIQLVGQDDSADTPIMNMELANALRRRIPSRFREYNKYQLIFSLQQHGASLNTLYQKCAYFRDYQADSPSICPSFLLIQDDGNSIFGAFTTEMWKSHSGSGTAEETRQQLAYSSSSPLSRSKYGTLTSGRSYYGSGECFLFKWISDDQTSKSSLIPYEWTQKNDYFMLSESDFMAMGSGDGKFGIFIDHELYRGFTSNAPTFSNTTPLCTDAVKGEFKIVNMEIWGML
ncbi:hypothetical protein MIR68_011630 [Amoeboaphelidium protococcarum]|nr:hypothetical protein MIR68_011630 [Amoeboaphelidium protococcarum]